MYCRLLEGAVHDLKNETQHDPSRTSVEIGLTGHIPKPYIPSDARRMEAYRRVAQARSAEDLAKVERDLTDAYGEIPEPVRRTLELAEIRVSASLLGVRSISIRGRDVLLRCVEAGPVEERLRESAAGSNTGSSNSGTVKSLPPPSKSESAEEPLWEVYFRPPESYLEPVSLARVLRKRLARAAATVVA
jgi:transcription-repair coupling factor (superfamily II helicase)